MSVITIDSAFLIERLNCLPPHSRKRAGICDLLREIRYRELQDERLHQECESAMETAFADDPEFQQHLREVW